MVVLVVDDEMIIRATMAAQLRAHGYEVLTAGNGRDALGVIKDGNDVKVLVTDHSMPGMTGADLVAEVRRNYPGIKTVVVSAHKEAEDLAKEAGAHRFCHKPVCFLVEVVEQVAKNGD